MNPSTKKIAVISHWGFKSLHGGNLRAYFLIRELVRRGHPVTVVLADPADERHCQELFGCATASVGVKMSRWQSAAKKIIQYLIFGRKVRRFLEKSDFDAVFGINLIQALPAVGQEKAESWVMYADLWADFFEYDEPPSFINKILVDCVRRAEFSTMRRADKLVMITEAMRLLVPPDIAPKVIVISDGTDTQHFYPGRGGEEMREKYGLGKLPIFSYQGGIARHEGLDLICRAAPYVLQKIPDAKFLIVGKGSFVEHCKKIIRDNESESAFVFTGWIDYMDMPKIFSAVDVSIVPTPNVKAGWPIISFKLLEAIATQTLVVVNGIPGPLEIVDKTMAVVTNAEDPERFAEDMVHAYHLPVQVKNEMTRKALAKARTLDWRDIAKRDVEYFTRDFSTVETVVAWK